MKKKKNIIRGKYSENKDEMLDFLHKNYSKISAREVADYFYDKYGYVMSEKSVSSFANRYGVKCKNKRKSALTVEQLNWLKKMYQKTNYSAKDLTFLFEEEYSVKYSVDTLYKHFRRNNIYKDKNWIHRGKRALIYTLDVKKFIKKCIKDGLTRAETKEELQREFLHSFCINSLSATASSMGLSFNVSKRNTEINKFLATSDVVKLIKRVIKKHKKSKYTLDLYIRDEIIIKFNKNILAQDIRNFCNSKRIKLNRKL